MHRQSQQQQSAEEIAQMRHVRMQQLQDQLAQWPRGAEGPPPQSVADLLNPGRQRSKPGHADPSATAQVRPQGGGRNDAAGVASVAAKRAAAAKVRSMMGYDMRPWWVKSDDPQPYMMCPIPGPDFDDWEDTIAAGGYGESDDESAPTNPGQEYETPFFKKFTPDVDKLPLDGWEAQKERRVHVALNRIVERGWYDQMETKLDRAEKRHVDSVREHYAMRRDRIATPQVGKNTVPHHQWVQNVLALDELKGSTNIQGHFRNMVDRHRRAAQRRRDAEEAKYAHPKLKGGAGGRKQTATPPQQRATPPGRPYPMPPAALNRSF